MLYYVPWCSTTFWHRCLCLGLILEFLAYADCPHFATSDQRLEQDWDVLEERDIAGYSGGGEGVHSKVEHGRGSGEDFDCEDWQAVFFFSSLFFFSRDRPSVVFLPRVQSAGDPIYTANVRHLARQLLLGIPEDATRDNTWTVACALGYGIVTRALRQDITTVVVVYGMLSILLPGEDERLSGTPVEQRVSRPPIGHQNVGLSDMITSFPCTFSSGPPNVSLVEFGSAVFVPSVERPRLRDDNITNFCFKMKELISHCCDDCGDRGVYARVCLLSTACLLPTVFVPEVLGPEVPSLYISLTPRMTGIQYCSSLSWRRLVLKKISNEGLDRLSSLKSLALRTKSSGCSDSDDLCSETSSSVYPGRESPSELYNIRSSKSIMYRPSRRHLTLHALQNRACAQPDTVELRAYVTVAQVTAELPVRSAVLKQCTGGLAVRWVTTSKSPLLLRKRVAHLQLCEFLFVCYNMINPLTNGLVGPVESLVNLNTTADYATIPWTL
ncbi:hypothetical protein EJ02DRAFT_470332 [Clathrospora elynae]|uniref:Uncharacterized protein n=1 Tax=Clathrospora elynae TaxID=706981 RepID=A0A6A5SDQ5_9PLEO|nr:hypothetical protein EJ02DRAFT_470332 [Clathrospora elynae]